MLHQQILRINIKINMATIEVNFSLDNIVQRRYVVLALERNIISLYFFGNDMMEL